MGTLYYGSPGTPIEMEDRALAHLKLLITTKLRREESFTISWAHPSHERRGRSTVWLQPAIPLRFVFDSPEPAEIDQNWLEEMASLAHSTGGLRLRSDYFERSDRAQEMGEPSPAATRDEG